MRRILSLAVVVSCALMVTEAWGQFRGGYDRGRSDRGRGGYDRGRSDRGGRSSFFSRMDRDGDGRLEPDEIPDYAQRFIRPMLERAGLDPRRSVSISRLEEIRRDRDRDRGRDRDDDRRDRDRNSSSDEVLVPGFGSDFEDSPVPGFGSEELGDAWREEYDRRTLEYARDVVRRYDRNRNGILERNEWQSVSWRSPDPNESDLNMDGKLTQREMAERIASRNRNDRDRRSGGSSDWRSRFSFSRGGDSGRGRDSGRGDSSRGGDSSDWRARMLERMRGGGNSDGGGDSSDWRARMMARFGGGDSDRGRDGDSGRGGFRGFFGGRGGGDDDDDRDSESSDKRDTRSSYRLATQDDLLPRGIDDDFTRKDTNGDGQLAMFEYATRWDNATAAEFRSYDRNGDGVITATEYVEGPYDSSEGSSSSRFASRSSGREEYGSNDDDSSDDASNTLDDASSVEHSSDEGASGDDDSSSDDSSNDGSSPSVSDRVARYVDSYLTRRDSNKSGVLERDEWSEVKDPDAIDANRDGKLTRDELLRHYSR